VTPHHLHDAAAGAGAVELLVLAGALVLAAVYGAAAVRTARSPRGWPPGRTAAFLLGCALLAASAAPPLAAAAHHDPRAHAVVHLLAGMYAPVALVLGAPVTLLLRSGTPAVRRAVAPVLRSRALRVLSHPVTALLLGPASLALLYLTPLFAATQHDPLLHGLVHLHVVASGCLLAWVVAGPDPAPHRPGYGVRLLVLGVSAAAHAVLAKTMYAGAHPRGTGQDPEQLRAAAELMYYGGDVAELALAVAVCAAWYWRPVRRAGARTGAAARA
jgi:putative membrane protein